MRSKKLIVNVGVILIFYFIQINTSFAATYYVRLDGGSSTQCSGTFDAPYPGKGVAQECAFNHPFWALGPAGSMSKMVGGDTLIIDGANNARYMLGVDAPNTGRCKSSFAYDCNMRPIPSGTDENHPTRILGKSWDTGCSQPPQLWGTGRPWQVISLAGSHDVQMQCLEITDHSDCQENGPKRCNRDTPPFGPWASIGIFAADSSDVLLKNLNIHGLAKTGIRAGRLNDWTIEDTKITANSFAGFDGDIGKGKSSNSGTITFKRTQILFNGCGETYPDKKPYNCYSQDQGGYGDGLGTEKTGGDWVFNNSEISHNVSDGLDLLYHDGTGVVKIQQSRFEGNGGNQVKTATNTVIENSILVGNCAYFHDNPITWRSSGFNNCRASGNTASFSFKQGMKVNIANSTLTSNGDALVLSAGANCDGTEKLISRNNIFGGGKDYHGDDESNLYYASGAHGDGEGPCSQIHFDDDYSIIWKTKNIPEVCKGKGHSFCKDPKFVGPMTEFYKGNEYNLNLQTSSPAIGKALILPNSSNLDYNGYARGNSWDIGALEYGSVLNPAKQ